MRARRRGRAGAASDQSVVARGGQGRHRRLPDPRVRGLRRGRRRRAASPAVAASAPAAERAAAVRFAEARAAVSVRPEVWTPPAVRRGEAARRRRPEVRPGEPPRLGVRPGFRSGRRDGLAARHSPGDPIRSHRPIRPPGAYSAEPEARLLSPSDKAWFDAPPPAAEGVAGVAGEAGLAGGALGATAPGGNARSARREAGQRPAATHGSARRLRRLGAPRARLAMRRAWQAYERKPPAARRAQLLRAGGRSALLEPQPAPCGNA